ncbi:MAG: rod shape-determining protein RodA [Deltaproteobacteria bacterium]|nr:rod shape-determining protein RodA [Deltaproteobacteria bacterium]MBW2122474.1 rod shape-determining protein RodA [Deltaproteobacteria bacterium]
MLNLIDRRLIDHLDWSLILLVSSLMTIGLLNLYSTTLGETLNGVPIYLRQAIWFSLGFLVMFLVAFVDYRHYQTFAYVIFPASLVPLLILLAYHLMTGGVHRWIRIGPISFQPSEPVKISLVLALSRFFSKNVKADGYLLRDLIIPFFGTAVAAALILLQPDLGTAMVLFLILFSILFFVKIRLKSFLFLTLSGLATLPLVWNSLKGYQKDRILAFFDPGLDPLGSGYHIQQAKIAIGSGGLTGKGFLGGAYTKLGFIPARHTDFVLCNLAEEWGFVGLVVLLVLFLLVLLLGLQISLRSKDRFGAITAFGVVAMIFWHTFTNVGMVLGMMPVVGIPLPFLSYGGSSTITVMVGIGLLLNISMRRYVF